MQHSSSGVKQKEGAQGWNMSTRVGWQEEAKIYVCTYIQKCPYKKVHTRAEQSNTYSGKGQNMCEVVKWSELKVGDLTD